MLCAFKYMMHMLSATTLWCNYYSSDYSWWNGCLEKMKLFGLGDNVNRVMHMYLIKGHILYVHSFQLWDPPEMYCTSLIFALIYYYDPLMSWADK